ncbi:MAG TPA: DUF2254 domain-containing protein [Thermoanaerobaculia bacterium]|nr:DUF2254 domain-containing protein [Thermoanaerobaculia bacterium]
MRHSIPEAGKLLLNSLRASFWFVPGTMLLGSLVLAIGAIRLDRAGLEVPWLRWFETTEGARAILTTVASSMITVTGVVFSITIVALTLASSQFGPRLLRGFMRDRANQLVLGTFVSTFLYCLVVLSLLPPPSSPGSIPQISVSLAVVLALSSLLVLVFFIHHVSTSIQAESVIGSVIDEMDGQLRRLESRARAPDPGSPDHVLEDTGEPRCVRARSTGYLRGVDDEELVRWAQRRDAIVALEQEFGDFVIEGDVLMRVYGAATAGEVDDEADEMREALSLGERRTPERDLRFLFQQLVEIALRALSPGINDPITAVACIRRLAAALCAVAPLPPPPQVHCDREGRPRLLMREPSFDDYLSCSLDPLRAAGASHTMVLLAMLDLLGAVAERTESPERRATLAGHLDALRIAGERGLPHPRDRQEIERRAEPLRRALAQVVSVSSSDA